MSPLNNTPKYIYELPAVQRNELCRILDQDNKWEELGTRMKFTPVALLELRIDQEFRKNSPTNALLTKWGHENHSILELYFLLAEMEHREAVLILKNSIASAYNNNLILKVEQNLGLNDLSQPSATTNDLLPSHSAVHPNEEGLNWRLQSEFSKIRIRNEKGSTSISNTAILSSGLKQVPIEDLKVATRGWNRENILGVGGYGAVYKGFWRSTHVAIKRTRNPDTDRSHQVQIESIENELKNLNSYRHDNILPIYGFSIKGNEVCLIYQYMANGSLSDRLFCKNKTKPLTWCQRLNIATGTARGLQFLHDPVKSLVHGDIKSPNILLDANFVAKIGDFGLAREGPYKHYTCMKISRVRGTTLYLPDEYLRNKEFSAKVDIYSFGIVLFELATGLKLCDKNRSYPFLKDLVVNCNQSELKKLADKKAGRDKNDTAQFLLSWGICCVNKKPKERPDMVSILQDFETAKLISHAT